MSKKNNTVRSLEEVLSAANAAYDKNKEEHPNIYSESGRVHFVQGWLEQAYKSLHEVINSK